MDNKSLNSKIKNNCNFCTNFRHEEVGDSDYGAVYSDKASCSKYHDFNDDTEEDIVGFDRDIERECCDLDFWKVLEDDKFLSIEFDLETTKTDGCFSETYELFLAKYKSHGK